MSKENRKKESIGGAKARRFPEHEWNFDSVPDRELMACCYWEYARESDFIRRVVRRLKDVDDRKGVTKPLQTLGKPWVQTHCLRFLEEAGAKVELPALRWGAEHDYSQYYKQMLEEAQAELVADNLDFTRLYSIGTPVELLRRLLFPKPWQSLKPAQRSAGKDFVVEIPTPEQIPPFRVTGDLLIASVLYGEATKAHNARQAAWLRLAEIDGGGANLEEATELRNKLCEQQQHPTPVTVQGVGGVDSFIAQINWREFTNGDIKKCFSKWLDEYPRPIAEPSERGHKPVDWQARLERLGLLRLRSRNTFNEAKPFLQQLYPQHQSAQSQPPRKYSDKGECNREAKKAVDDFNALFPFLDPDDKPRSWPMK